MGIAKNVARVLRNLVKVNRKMTHLDLRKNVLGDEGLAEIALALRCSASLVHIDLSSNDLGAKGGSQLFKALAANDSITSVDVSSHEGLHRNHLGEKGVKRLVSVLQHNKILSILNLSGNGLKMEGLAYVAEGVAGNSTLMSLKIAQNEIAGSPQCVQHLKTILIESRLIELDISDNPLGNACVDALGQIIGNSGMTLRKLYMTNTGFTCNSLFC